MNVNQYGNHIIPRISGLLTLTVLILLGLIGLLSRWQNPIELFQKIGSGGMFTRLVDFPINYGNTFNGNFFLRENLIKVDYKTRYYLMGETVYPQVLIGRDGWMYYTGEGNLDYYQRIRPLTPERVSLIAEKLESIQKDLAHQDVLFLFVIAPNKETIVPEYVPADISITANPTWADQITGELAGSNVNVLDLRTSLAQEKNTVPVYFKTDTHWNPLGAHIAYLEILNRLQPDFPVLLPHPLNDFDQVIETTSGDLAGLIYLKGEITEPFTALKARFEKPSRGLKNPPVGQMITVMPDKNLPTAVIFRDSFFNGLQPFTSEHFSRVAYVSSFNVDMTIIEEEKPQIVILEVAERYLDRLVK